MQRHLEKHPVVVIYFDSPAAMNCILVYKSRKNREKKEAKKEVI